MHLSTPKRRAAHVMIAAAASALLLSGCGFNAQTLQPYTPAEGVNTQIGDVKVRNLVVVSDDEGHGYLSASLVSPKNTALVSVAGQSDQARRDCGGVVQGRWRAARLPTLEPARGLDQPDRYPHRVEPRPAAGAGRVRGPGVRLR
ncbi:hypothetical protein [Propioniciclava flava]